MYPRRKDVTATMKLPAIPSCIHGGEPFIAPSRPSNRRVDPVPAASELSDCEKLKSTTPCAFARHPHAQLALSLPKGGNPRRRRWTPAFVCACSTFLTGHELFLMDFAPGGGNFPHHHETVDEIYPCLFWTTRGRIGPGAGWAASRTFTWPMPPMRIYSAVSLRASIEWRKPWRPFSLPLIVVRL
jgi:hypothetical protein